MRRENYIYEWAKILLILVFLLGPSVVLAQASFPPSAGVEIPPPQSSTPPSTIEAPAVALSPRAVVMLIVAILAGLLFPYIRYTLKEIRAKKSFLLYSDEVTSNTLKNFGDTEKFKPKEVAECQDVFAAHAWILEPLVASDTKVPSLIESLYRNTLEHHTRKEEATYPVIQYLGPDFDYFDHEHIQWRLDIPLMKASNAFYVTGIQAKTSIDALYSEPLSKLGVSESGSNGNERDRWFQAVFVAIQDLAEHYVATKALAALVEEELTPWYIRFCSKTS